MSTASGAVVPLFTNITANFAKSANALAQTASGAVSAVGDAATTAVNTVTKNLGNMSSLIPLGSSPKPLNNGPKLGNNVPKLGNNVPKQNDEWGFNMFGENNAKKAANNAAAKAANNAAAAAKAVNNAAAAKALNNATKASAAGILGMGIMANPIVRYSVISVVLIGIFLLLFYFYSDHIKKGYRVTMDAVKRFFGFRPKNPVDLDDIKASVTPTEGSITVSPQAPQDITPKQASVAASDRSLVETLLPTASKDPRAEVFNVNENDYTFYDAEPLCKALGAELATYEQVKDAWSKGADWCNYGWVKGQMAIYPTQKETYDMLQAGPADQHMACGTPGINGGHFENPEMRYGVNCYGKKPEQSAHDKQQLMQKGQIPRSPATLKVQEKVNEFRSEVDSIYVVPFNTGSWSEK